MKNGWSSIRHVLGIPLHTPSWREQWMAVLTSSAGLALVAACGLWLAPEASPWLMASMGATCVLVFAVPHGPLSQPWAVLVGHIASGMVGLLLARGLGHGLLAMSLAVGLAIGVMHLLRCLHPPGGATALYMVQATSSNLVPDWSLLWCPVLLNVLCVLLAGVLFNLPFAWRRYPAAWAYLHPPAPAAEPAHVLPFSEDELAQALDGLDEVFDITDEQLQWLYDTLLTRLEARQSSGQDQTGR